MVVINEDHDGILANNYKILILFFKLAIRDGNSTRPANIVNTAISAQLQISARYELAPLLKLKLF